MEEAIVHPDSHSPADSHDNPAQEDCHDVAEAAAAHSPPEGGRKAHLRQGWSASLMISIVLHAMMLIVAWKFAPVVVERFFIRPVMIFQEGEQNVGDPGGADALPPPQAIEMVAASSDPPPVQFPSVDLPEVLPVPIPDTQVHLPDLETASQEQEAVVIGLASSPSPLMSPYRSKSRVGPATGPAAAEWSPAPAMVVPAAPTVTGNYAPPKVARGFAGRRGLRGGLDDRGLPMPDYPAESRRRGEQGVVELQLQIRADGSVEKIDVLSDPGFPLLVKAAIDALRNARFDPALRDGQPVAGPLVIPFRFSLD